MCPYKQKLLDLFSKTAFPEDAFFSEMVFAGREILIYGAGEGFHWIQEIFMREFGYRPSVLLDRSFTGGGSIDGIPCFTPDAFKPTPDQKKNAMVIICVGKKEYHTEIVNCLEKMGFENILFMMDIYEMHNPFSLPPDLQTKGFGYFLEQKEQILAAFELLADDESREIFTGILQTHMQRKAVPLPAQPREEQYFPAGINLKQGYSRFVNCGAYDGDAIRLLNHVHGIVDEIACFETEPHLFGKLVKYLWENKATLAMNNIIAMPCAVYSHEAILPFKSGGGLGSRIHEDGDVMIQCISLDSALPAFKPTFICMDVEGAEPEVLKGAVRLLEESRPDLAVSVYHAPHHIWEIPNFLHHLNLGYTFYLRNYTTFTGETVLYASVG